MRAILMSIKPKWCELIFSGEKTVEVRKNAPKLKPPFKVYVYQTEYRLGDKFIEEVLNTVYDGRKVVGEFVCDKVEENIPDYHPMFEEFFYSCFECGNDCLSQKEMQKYGKDDTLYGWHITEPKLYDTPKELELFWSVRCTNKKGDCQTCEVKPACINNITRPPQSWCYVEEIEE